MHLEEDLIMDYPMASKFIGVKQDTLYVLVMQKRIPHIRLGKRFVRFSKLDLIKWMESLKQEVVK